MTDQKISQEGFAAACSRLDANPHDEAAFAALGRMFVKAGAPGVAFPCVLTAVQINPKSAERILALCEVLAEMGETARAHRCAVEGLANVPGDPDLTQACNAYRSMITEADVRLATFDHAQRHEISHTLNNIVATLRAGQLEEAFMALNAARWLAAHDPMFWLLLSYGAEIHPAAQYAEICARRAVAMAVKHGEPWTNLFRVLRDAPERRVAVEPAMRAALQYSDAKAAILDALVTQLIGEGRFRAAREALAQIEQTGALAPLDQLRIRARIEADAGGIQAAGELFINAFRERSSDNNILLAAARFFDERVDQTPFVRLLELARAGGADFSNPALSDAEARSLLRQRRFDAAFASICDALAGPADPAQKASRLYTLAAIEDKRGNFEAAYSAATEANEHFEAAYEYGRELDHRTPLRRLDCISAAYADAPEFPPAPAEIRNIAFLVGFPRSGTTLLDLVLRSHSRIEVIEEEKVLINALRKTVPGTWGDETNFHADWIAALFACDPTRLRENYLTQMARFAGEVLADDKVYIDKLPLNLNWAPLIHRIFPEVVFILALRHPLDCAISNFFQSYKPNNAMLNMTRISRINDLYNRSFALWCDFADERHPAIAEVRYENLVGDLEATVRPVMAALGLEWEDRQSAHTKTAAERGRIKTPSYTQVSQSLYTSSRERWRHYRFAFGDDDAAALRRWAARLGYDDGTDA